MENISEQILKNVNNIKKIIESNKDDIYELILYHINNFNDRDIPKLILDNTEDVYYTSKKLAYKYYNLMHKYKNNIEQILETPSIYYFLYDYYNDLPGWSVNMFTDNLYNYCAIDGNDKFFKYILDIDFVENKLIDCDGRLFINACKGGSKYIIKEVIENGEYPYDTNNKLQNYDDDEILEAFKVAPSNIKTWIYKNIIDAKLINIIDVYIKKYTIYVNSNTKQYNDIVIHISS